VGNPHPARLSARSVVVAAQDVEAAPHVAHDVVDERHVLDDRPRGAAALVADGEQDREAALRVRPVVLEHVALDDHTPSVLELEQVLDGPRDALEGGIAHLQVSGFDTWLCRISMSDGTTFGMTGS